MKEKKCICSILIGLFLIGLFLIGLFFTVLSLYKYCFENIGIFLVLIVLIAFIFLFWCKKFWIKLIDIFNLFWCKKFWMKLIDIFKWIQNYIAPVFLLVILIAIVFSLLVLLIFFSKECPIEPSDKIEMFRCLFGINAFNFVNIGTAFGGLVTLLLYQRRNQAIEKQTKKQYETFNKDKQFSNYLEATKLLTGENATTDAKIAAMFSLADVTKDHPEKVGRVIQVINQELIPFKKNIESYTQKTLKEWRYKGGGIERTFSTALYIIRKIILGLPKSDSNLDISQTILFDIDIAFDKNYKNDDLSSIGKNKRIEDLIFCYCKLENVNFSEMNYHTCKFIRCNLKKANFDDANLWGTSFIGCDLEETEFKTAECEDAEFKNCKNLTLEQLDQMKFKNLKDAKGYEFKNIQNIRLYESKNKDGSKNKKPYSKENLKYLVVIDKETLAEINKSKKLEEKNFITREEYNEWKNSTKIDNDDKNKKSSRK